MNIPKITQQTSSKGFNSCIRKLGSTVEKIQNTNLPNKLLKSYEPTGANNSFIALATLMVSTVLFPRVSTAAKRNPNDKEATKDEIKEILFRDVQSIVIILFALKSMNSLIAAASTKAKGIPMVNKQFKALFNTKEKGFNSIIEKGKEIINHPVEKAKIMFQNAKDLFYPTSTKGIYSLTNADIESKYSGYSDINQIKKLFKDIPNHGGDSKKVYDKVLDDLIEEQTTLLEGNGKAGSIGLIAESTKTMQNGKIAKDIEEKIENAKKLKEALGKAKEDGVESFIENGFKNEDVATNVLQYFQNKNNGLVYEAKKLNAILSTTALGIEASYLGFGLPALNQKRLEKKYLSEKPMGLNPKEDTYTPLNDRHIKAQEIKLYSNFIKK